MRSLIAIVTLVLAISLLMFSLWNSYVEYQKTGKFNVTNTIVVGVATSLVSGVIVLLSWQLVQETAPSADAPSPLDVEGTILEDTPALPEPATSAEVPPPAEA
jgi:heme/copper-type cytochrome/quinol oxidase subunit 2